MCVCVIYVCIYIYVCDDIFEYCAIDVCVIHSNFRYVYIYIFSTYRLWMYIYIYIHMDITCFTAPTQCFQVFCIYIYICVCVRVSEMLCTFQRCCARVRDVVHVSEMLCTCQR